MRPPRLRIHSLLLLFIVMQASAWAQGTPRKITFSNFKVQENVNQYGKGITGLELRYDLYFNWEEPDFFKQSFTQGFRMVQGDRLVLESAKMASKPGSVLARPGTQGGKAGMWATGQKLFIPYLEIPLESGPQKAGIIFSFSNGDGTYTDCHTAALSWQHRKVVRYDLNAQEFTFQPPVIDYAGKEFARQEVSGMSVTSDIGLKYGPEECMESKYELACLIRKGGKVVFDSRQSRATFDKTRSIAVELKEGKPAAKVSFFIHYQDLQMDGPAQVELVYVLLGAEGGPKEIHARPLLLDVPPKYSFEDQEFRLRKVEVEEAVEDGVQGLAVHFACGFKYASILRDPERGKYQFYLALMDGKGKLAMDLARAPKQGFGTAHLMDGHLPSATDTIARGHLFIPHYMLHTPAGSQTLSYALMVSDVNLGTKFPVLAQGTITLTKPEERSYWVAVEQLEMIDANYDAEFIPPGSHLPELQYLFCVGEDAFYESSYVKNSLHAVPGGALLRLSRGDELSLKLYDVDSGFFNASDLQGRWKIDYMKQGDHFSYEVQDQGQVKGMRLKVDRRDQ